jgi:hypothetical protein
MEKRKILDGSRTTTYRDRELLKRSVRCAARTAIAR